MSKNKLEYNYEELISRRNFITTLMNNTWDKSDQKITANLEFKLSFILKSFESKAEHYEDQRKKILKDYVNTDDQGNLKFKGDDDKSEEDEEKPSVKGNEKKPQEEKELDWKDEDSKEKAQEEIESVFNEKVSVTIPVTLKISDFVDKQGNPLELGGIGYFISDLVSMEE